MNVSDLLYEDLAQAVKRLQVHKKKSDNDLMKAGSIQYFEFCFDLSWETIKTFVESEGLPDCYSPKLCFKTAFKNKWIGDETVC